MLLVDDEPNLLDLAKRFIERENRNITIVTAESALEALERIEEDTFDIIVSDYQMPKMTGLELLARIRSKGSDIPFIVWTGRSREEVAIKALNLGATYYIKKGADIKSQYVQLSHLITRAVEHHRASQALFESEEKYRTLVEESLFGIEIFCLNPFRVLFVNEALTDILGYSSEIFYESSFEDLQEILHPHEIGDAMKMMSNLLGGEKIDMAELQLKHQEGHYVQLRVRISRTNYQGQECFIAYALDISEQKRVKLEIKKKNILLNSINDLLILAQSTTDRKAIGRFALDVAEKITEAKYSAILGLTRGRNVDFWILGDEAKSAISLKLPESGFPSKNAWSIPIYKGESVVVNDYSSEYPEFDDNKDHIFISSFMAVPLILDNLHLGVIGLANKAGGFNDLDVELIETLAVPVADILYTAQREEELVQIREISPVYLDKLDTIFLSLDRRGKVVSINKTCSNLLGISPDRIIGMDWFENFIPPEDRTRVRKDYSNLMEGKIDPIPRYENKIMTVDGEIREVRWFSDFYETADGQIAGTYSTGIDITEAKRTELELKQREVMFQTLFEGINIPIMLVDKDGNYLDANEAALEFLECTLDELKTKTVWDFSVDVAEDMTAHSPFVSVRKNITHYNVQGKIKTLSLTVQPVETEHGPLLFGIGIDITDEFEKQKSILKEANQQRRFLDSLRDGVWFFNTKWKTEYVNPMMCELLGYTHDEFLGRPLLDFVYPERYEDTLSKMKNRESGLVETHDFVFRKKDGSPLYTEVRASPVFEGEHLVGFIASISDMTRWKETENLLRKQKEELSDFAHRMSHDLKALLHNILGYVELIEDEYSSPFTEGIGRQVDRIQSLLNRSVELADSGQVIGEKKILSLESLLDEIKSEYDTKGIEFHIDDLPIVKGDLYKLDQVFSNLIRNAIEHGNPNRISITSEPHEDSVDVLVKNDGKTIDAELRPYLLTSQISSKAGGGMGLVIVQRIIEAHGWQVSIDDSDEVIYRIRIPNEDIIDDLDIS